MTWRPPDSSPRSSAPPSAPTSTSTSSGSAILECQTLEFRGSDTRESSIAEFGGAFFASRADGFFEVLGGEADVELGVALVVHVRRQAAGVEARPQQPL